MDKSDYIVLESNYDTIMLDYGNYPFNTKKRIKSQIGHLSNLDSANVIFNILNKDNNKEILLSHLSCNNNSIPVAKDTIFNHLNSNNINNFNINFATKNLSFERYFA
jgi:phosphoribosyl 1,2-cyclic phosphodiesterase